MEVLGLCDPPDVKNGVLMGYQRSHHPSSRPDKATARTSYAMEAFRASLRADPAYIRYR